MLAIHNKCAAIYRMRSLFIAIYIFLFSLILLWLTCQPHRLQHARVLCLSLSPRVCSNSCPLSQQCYLIISSSATPFSCLQSFPVSGFFSNESALHISWPKYWSWVLPMNIQGWFPLGLTDLISIQSRGFSRVSSNTKIWKHQFLHCSVFFMIQLLTTKMIVHIFLVLLIIQCSLSLLLK